MPKNLRSDIPRLLIGVVILSLVAACAGPKVQVYEGPDGTVIVESMQTKATVTAIDARTRTVTLKRKFNEAKTFKAGENAVNFNQIQVGDEVHAVVVEEVAVTLIPGGAPPMVGAAEAVALAPDGSKPGIVMADSVEMTAEITAIDAHARQVSIEFPDGSGKTVKVGKHIDLTQVALGDSVAIQITEAVAIEVVKPR